MMNEEQMAMLAELRQNICYCHKPKRPHQTLCRPCFLSLPAAMQRSLYQRIGRGYESAYTSAKNFLDSQKAKATERGTQC